MKKQYWSIVLLSVLLGACDLEQTPEATTTRDAVFNSEKGLEVYSNSFYVPLTNPDYSILPTANNQVRGDEMSDFAARTQVPDFLRDGAFGPRQSSGWDWRALRNINFFIENAKPSPDVSTEAREHYLGVARFFRAMFYFDKVKRFGDVPWINKTMSIEDPDLYNNRDSRTLVMDSVLADLDYAGAHVREAADNSRSTVTRYVVYGFKSRVCLFEGTFRKYHTEYNLGGAAAKWLEEAADAAQMVMDKGGYLLNESGGPTASYRQVFISRTPVTSEVMLAAAADANLSLFNDANWYWTSATYGSRVSFTRTFINTYLLEDGTPFTDQPGHETMIFADEVKGRDKRLQQTIRMGNYTRVNAGKREVAPPVFSYTYTGYQPIKWTLDDTYYDGGTRNDNSVALLRYAEVLLNYAEARAELETITTDDWTKTVGALRRRAGITGDLTTLPTVLDDYMQTEYFSDVSNPVLMEIRRERGIELALEGLRFYDLVRWKHGELLLKVWNGLYVPALDVPMDLNEDGVMDVAFYKAMPANPVKGVTYVNVGEKINNLDNPQRLSHDTAGEITWLANVDKGEWNDKRYLYPIPETDSLMNPALGQNPGWY
ncbi:RagB/SusD family nutrient uptake outer membrane protein [Fulvivirgaceae bacterium PWU5]|uniref:RagB/SusD family nutrient uptake outer membrane protein n=1 Tax=Dawidia cretensis TaxID=2782350 RepID=A0AAP2DWS2_9BACT|nr:RagB/SusD family nutrient uptake outer membrane protein [Dawidia cretensis]MBT1707119.1 RagB/SusD family nutrient uptake outer membrane protein [Dawidia cretensis]